MIDDPRHFVISWCHGIQARNYSAHLRRCVGASPYSGRVRGEDTPVYISNGVSSDQVRSNVLACSCLACESHAVVVSVAYCMRTRTTHSIFNYYTIQSPPTLRSSDLTYLQHQRLIWYRRRFRQVRGCLPCNFYSSFKLAPPRAWPLLGLASLCPSSG
jgi:hypothetical protein